MLITVSLFLQISVNIFNCRARSMAPYIQNERFGRKAETLIFRCARMPDTPAILSNLSFQRPRVAPYQEFAALLHQRDEAGGICRSLQKNEENRQNPSNSSFLKRLSYRQALFRSLLQ